VSSTFPPLCPFPFFINSRSLSSKELSNTDTRFLLPSRSLAPFTSIRSSVHHQGIIHRDIKPANLLWNKDHSVVKISDFGVSHYSSVLRLASGLDDELDGINSDAYIALDEEALAKTAGSPAFFAPELCYNGDFTPLAPSSPATSTRHLNAESNSNSSAYSTSQITINRQAGIPSFSSSFRTNTNTNNRRSERPKVTKAIDVWALGVTLYCLLFAKVPFEAPTEFALFAVIPNEDFEVPRWAGKERFETGGKEPGEGTSWEARELADLLKGMLEKDPEKRIKLEQVKVSFFVKFLLVRVG